MTGDGDFIPLVEYLRTHSGCQVEVVSFGRSTSGKLKEATDYFLDLDEDPKRYLLNYRGGSTRRSSTRGTRDIEVSAPDDSMAEQGDDVGKITGVE